jgi:hypothetical protein
VQPAAVRLAVYAEIHTVQAALTLFTGPHVRRIAFKQFVLLPPGGCGPGVAHVPLQSFEAKGPLMFVTHCRIAPWHAHRVGGGGGFGGSGGVSHLSAQLAVV